MFMTLSNNFILRKVILVSYFLSLAIFIDLVGKFLTPFLNLNLGGQIFKFSLVILCLSGIYNNFSTHLLICGLYSAFHLIKSYNFLLSLDQLFLFTKMQLLISCIFDYILPDLLLSLVGVFIDKKKFIAKNKKNIFFGLLLVYFLRSFCFFISSYWVYANMQLSLGNLWYDWLFNLFNLRNVNDKLLLICFIYCLILFIINVILSNLLLFLILSKITSFFDKYL
ncbi:MAG: hypothetical protein Q8762_01875 [Pigeon pea little leaf phytoplasma]|nr:hypothetical protein ['Bituminaria bituminosa' little leaf phytoplasma]MDV3154247.1 hypothetical protein [Pigeon pea little leaf phytoplasma]MDO8024031.1 hypothetical protein ['Bituminaria bituminosa' little leaf phytoplasma]MDV3158767.1 hypothetical protein [Pigeon pea little leaf phytoplasma]MDV3163507.1 hypothetical protein [Pigeon pea little leaf phytoplasma]MDV3164536.1 hypothetical protein [Pigeon pea little leaf phytoplasma]